MSANIDSWQEAFIYILAMWKCMDIVRWANKKQRELTPKKGA